ncbi:MAG: tetratricopeptide repeat protein [Pseudomonadota bacterium]
MSRATTIWNAAAFAVMGATAGCASQPDTSQIAFEETDGLLPASDEERAIADRSDPLTRASFWAEEHAKAPTDVETTVRYANALRAINSHERAAEVVTQTIALHPRNADLAMILGRSYLSLDNIGSAIRAFEQAVVTAPNEAAPYAGLGLALDRSGQHEAAQRVYREALARDPDRVSTLSNYGLSLALSGDLSAAESALREAAEHPDADVKVRQNLALVLGLQGRFDEMRALSERDAPADLVERNMAALRAMLGPVRRYDLLDDDQG